MSTSTQSPVIPAVLRWIARIWSLLLAAFAVTMAVTPDPTIVAPVPLEDWILLGFWGVAILALLIGWRWETLGAVAAIVTMLLRELAWVILKGPWIVNFLIVWAVILPPAVMYLVSDRLIKSRAGRSPAGS